MIETSGTPGKVQPVSGRPQGGGALNALREEFWLWAKSGTRQWQLTKWVERLGIIPEAGRYRYWLVDRPNYAYGVHRAAQSARRLGFQRVTVVEFGVAGGNGLLALERHARYLGDHYGVQVDVVGFDSGEGMAQAHDYRDQPFRWGAGFYRMDEAALRARITNAELVMGDVKTSAGAWVAANRDRLQESPIGFISFDLDYWSSTMSAFELFRYEDVSHLLPRIVCWMDDIIYSIESIGELQAISEFNAEEPGARAIGQVVGLRAGLPFDPPWAEQIFETHLFNHPRYNDLIEDAPEQLPLESSE
jgi:hypothetical protein